MNKKINKTYKYIIIWALVLMFVLAFAMPKAQSFAETPPYTGSYQQVQVYVNGSRVSDIAFTIKGNVYIKLDTLEKYGDTSKLKINTSAKKVIFNPAEMNISTGCDDVNKLITENAGECYVIIKSFADENNKTANFVSIGQIAQMAKLSWSYAKGKLYLTQYSASGNLAKAGILRGSAASLHNESIEALHNGEKVFITGETRSFYKVSKNDGNSFYVNKNEVTKIDDPALIPDFEYTPKAKDSFNTKINVGFLNLADSSTRTPLPPENTAGLDVLCPPWMHQMVEQNGQVNHICDYGYVQLAHSKGLKVWIMVNNSFVTKGSSNYTTKVMGDDKLTDKVIAQYLMYAMLNEADGINVDYEDLRKTDRDLFSSFISKLGHYCDELGLTLSVDTSTPESYNTMYDWQALSAASDYIIPMSYVEHMANSVGSVSSYGWYSSRMLKLINEEGVPKEKILMGVPFFSRYYYVTGSGSISLSGVLSMKTQRARITSAGTSPTWNVEAQQFVAEYPNGDGRTVKMWLEDSHSIASRLNFVLESDIAGTACWALDQEEEGTLQIFEEIYKEGTDPSEFYNSSY